MKIRYLQEFTVLGTAGGMYHFRDQIRAGNPSAFFVLNGDVCSDFPLGELYCFHKSKGSKAMVFISFIYSISGVYDQGHVKRNHEQNQFFSKKNYLNIVRLERNFA